MTASATLFADKQGVLAYIERAMSGLRHLDKNSVSVRPGLTHCRIEISILLGILIFSIIQTLEINQDQVFKTISPYVLSDKSVE